jgi:hypothetical protein
MFNAPYSKGPVFESRPTNFTAQTAVSFRRFPGKFRFLLPCSQFKPKTVLASEGNITCEVYLSISHVIFSNFFWQPKVIHCFSIFAPVISFTLPKLCLKSEHSRLFVSLFTAAVPSTQVVVFVLSWLECSRLVREAVPGIWCRVSRKVGESLRSALSFSYVKHLKTRGSLTLHPYTPWKYCRLRFYATSCVRI